MTLCGWRGDVPDPEPPHERIARLERELAAIKDVLADEVGTNLRIAERIGILKAIEAGKSYEDAEVERFEALTQAADTLAAGLRKLGHGTETPGLAQGVWVCPEWGYGTPHQCPGCAALSSWDAFKEKP